MEKDRVRINAIDGLRTIAVLGVLWAHLWAFMNAPSLMLAGIDVARLLSFGGTGVDLFFVISGFCMFLMHHLKSKKLTRTYLFGYLKKDG